jgi:prepilin-type N-terminal cleavage/methylation domain-containing protein
MNKKAFTLIELLVVISIIGILSGLIAIGMNGATTAAADSKKKATVDSIKKSLVIDKVDTGNYPIETGCTIGADCTNLDSVLLQYLPPDLGATYTYESDGSDCTISTILSNGHVYQYDCLTSSYSTNVPINGSCGLSNGSNLSSAPSTNLCNLGDATAVTGTGPWAWSCAGIHGGTSASCQTSNVPVDGVCGTAHSSNSYSIPSTNLCSAGTPSVVSGSGPWTWTCNGSYTGLSPVCAANTIIDGSCGTANKTYAYSVSSYGSDTYCATGTTTPTTPAFPDNGAITNWTCVGLNTGLTASCSASRNAVPVNGSCGTANNSNSYSIPTTNLCTLGNATSVSGSGPWTWTCAGLNGGTTSGTCTANKKVDGVCGSANGKKYSYSASSYGSDTFCSVGTANPTTPSFPAEGGSFSWSCVGQNLGVTASCTASRYPLVGICGTAGGKIYPAGTTSYGSDTYCTTGEFSGRTAGGPFFPSQQTPYGWACGSTLCSACQYNNTSAWINSWKAQCESYGGTFIDGGWSHILCINNSPHFGGSCPCKNPGEWDICSQASWASCCPMCGR